MGGIFGEDMFWIFDHTDFVARSDCGRWGNLLPILNQTANIFIAIAYTLIPVFLIILFRKRKESIPSPHILVWFGAFILLCGLSHVCNVLAFTHPMYRFFTIVDILTAIASIGTLCQLPTVIHLILLTPTLEQYTVALAAEKVAKRQAEILISELKDKDKERQQEITILEKQIESLRGGSNPYEVLNDLIGQLQTINNKYKR